MPGFYPSAGTLSDVFNFWVYYYDQDGDAPTVKNIYVDGVDHPLTLWSGTPSSGYYHYETSLPLGTHDYRFYFEDGRGGTARSPIVATLPGPVVVLDHIVSQPSAPTGEAAPSPGVSRSYTTATSICNLGHAVQYRFDWGDGGTSDWLPVGQTSEAHAWAAAGAYLVRAQARCSVVPAVISSWTEALSVNVAGTLRKTDLNGDGQEDILWRYCGMGGYIRTWFMSNTDGAASAITPSDGEMTPESGHQEPNHRMSGEALFPSFMSGKGKSGPINKGERSRPADIMCASAKRTRGAGSVDDPRKAGTGLQMPIFGVCSDPRQVSSPPHQGLTPSLSSERVASPQLLGGADVMPVGDLNWEIVGSGDFNNDSRTDILWRNISNGANVVWFMNGTEWSGSAELLPVGDQSWEIVGTGDFNRDGNVDILWRNSVSGDNVVWYMNGTTWIGSAILLKVTDQSWHIVGTGDFDKDGNIDILWRYNGAGGYNVVWHLDNATWIASSELIPVGDTNWQIVGTGDYNNDGNIDILWRYNGPGGYNGIWYMNGMTWIGSAELLPVPDLSWKIVNR
ncbi:MAG: hypothetical protein C3F08_00390 [Candidatus Methylomirabilota bacterium]|nr:MAG: hypothetical protein C3F08_00390 [candidate division NC10 bacterium]